jgi:hypothetical protein
MLGVMAEIRLMRPPVNGLEQTFRERCLSATPNSRPTRREAAGGRFSRLTFRMMHWSAQPPLSAA